ncbi:Dimethyladenosine transferase (rRNA methylation) [Anopheles sinensis]|uniref:Dimethyladenosine transferase (RRNA methylation) n=1 Tax=Anopheles sinensis TaxID=74873 RepID=A0A084VPE1_ANOSI|nr:Dimethyladenosine transferase (rRNA methylation) [Anopheles sinensis]
MGWKSRESRGGCVSKTTANASGARRRELLVSSNNNNQHIVRKIRAATRPEATFDLDAASEGESGKWGVATCKTLSGGVVLLLLDSREVELF